MEWGLLREMFIGRLGEPSSRERPNARASDVTVQRRQRTYERVQVKCRPLSMMLVFDVRWGRSNEVKMCEARSGRARSVARHRADRSRSGPREARIVAEMAALRRFPRHRTMAGASSTAVGRRTMVVEVKERAGRSDMRPMVSMRGYGRRMWRVSRPRPGTVTNHPNIDIGHSTTTNK